MTPAAVPDRRASLLLMVASGFAGLGYQIVWTQQCALWLGHESAAVLAVVAAFFGGLAAGAFVLGARIERSARPERWYAGCELGIALWGLLLVLAMPWCGERLSHWLGLEGGPLRQWSVAFAGTFLLLLPATAAMGATLPAIARVIDRLRHDGSSIAGLYAANTLGAVIGVLATAFWLVPAMGFRRTAAVCVALNVLCAVAALLLWRREAAAAAPPSSRRDGDGALLVRLLLTGLLGIGYEVLVIRVLSQVTEDTVYTFALLLAVYLIGTAAGAAALERWRSAPRRDEGLQDRLLTALSVACLVGGASLWGADRVLLFVRGALGGGAVAAVLAEAALAVLAFALPTMVMGALFSHLGARAATSGIGLGRALGTNTLGAAAAPVLVGVLVIPALGAKMPLGAIALGYLALASRNTWGKAMVLGPAAAAVGLVLLAPPLVFVEVPPGGRLVGYREGVAAAVSVVEDADGVATLRINNRQQEGSSATLRVDGRQAWLPLLLHPHPSRALFLGLGTGITAASAALDTTLEVDAVELLPEVIDASGHFLPALTGGAELPGLRRVAADARRYVRASERRYDVIVSDNFHPARSGSGSLYTVEHFAAVQSRLAPGGLFCQWLPLHQMDLETLRSIVRSFLRVHPGGWALIASNSLATPVLGLVATVDGARFDVAAIVDRLRQSSLPSRVRALGLEDELAVLGSFVAGPEQLDRLAGDAPANTDDLPVVAYRAPRITYAADSTPGERLMALLRQVGITPAQLVQRPADALWPHRLASYFEARNRFLVAGQHVVPSPEARQMLASVREPLLAVLRISPDFRPAYDPLLAMAEALAPIDAAGARSLLGELSRLAPDRLEAPRLLARMEIPHSARLPPQANLRVTK